MFIFDKPVSKLKEPIYKVQDRIPLESDLLVKNCLSSLKDNIYYNIKIIHRTKHLKIGNILGCKHEILKLKELEFYLDFVVVNVSILSEKVKAEIVWN